MICEPNNLIPDAIDSGVGSSEESNVTFSSTIDSRSDIDLYRFQLNKGQGITLDIDTDKDTTDFDSYLRVFDAEGNELADNDDFSPESSEFSLDAYIGFIANAKAEYYVGVSDTTVRDYNPFEVNDFSLFQDDFEAADYDLSLNIVEVESDKDPDNTISEAIALSTDGQTQSTVSSAEITTESDVDLYEIELGQAKGVRLRIDTRPDDSQLDSYLRVFDASGNELAFNNNSEDPDNLTTDSILAFAPPTPGKYYIGVSSAGNFEYDAVNGDTNLNFSPNTGISTGSYDLQLEIVDVVSDTDTNNTISEAIDTSIGSTNSNSPVVKNGEISSKFDVDIFKFQLQESEGIKLDINANELGSDLDSYLRIFDSQGNELNFDDNNDANFTGDFSPDSNLAFVPDTPGEYYVGVGTSGNFDYDPINGRTNFSGDNVSPFTTTGSYELILNSVAVVGDRDPDNTIAEARDSGIGMESAVEFTGEIDLANDVDFYQLQLDRGEGVTFDLDAAPDSDLDSYLRLFDSQGNQLAFDNDDDNNFTEDSSFDSLLRFAPESSGEYFIAVSSDGNTDYDPISGSDNFTPTTGLTTGSYSLAVNVSEVIADRDPDNTITEAIATEVASGKRSTTIGDTIDSKTDVDLFQVELNEEDTVIFDIDTAETNSELDSVLQIFNADGEELDSNDDSAVEEDSSLDSYIEFTASTTGTYYVGVSSYGRFDYDVVNGSNNFSNDVGTTTGEYSLTIAIAD